MDGDRGLAVLAHEDQWARCVHERTVLLAGGGVGLDWEERPAPSRWGREGCPPGPEPPPRAACPAGITHDRWCRTWRSRPLEGRVELTPPGQGPPIGSCPGGLRHPTGVAVD